MALYACMNDIYVADPWREVDITLDRFDKPNLVLANRCGVAAAAPIGTFRTSLLELMMSVH